MTLRFRAGAPVPAAILNLAMADIKDGDTPVSPWSPVPERISICWKDSEPGGW